MRKKKKNILSARSLFLIILFGFSVWFFGLVSFVDNIPLTSHDPDTITDGIVVLTGGSNRLDKSIKLLDEGKAKKLFISGVGEEVDLQSLLILSGELPDNVADLVDRIELGYDAKNTKGNAEEVLQWVRDNGYKSIRLVTANYHIQRSMVEFRALMPDVKIIAIPVIPERFFLDKWWRYYGTRKLLITEYNKFLVSNLRSVF